MSPSGIWHNRDCPAGNYQSRGQHNPMGSLTDPVEPGLLYNQGCGSAIDYKGEAIFKKNYNKKQYKYGYWPEEGGFNPRQNNFGALF